MSDINPYVASAIEALAASYSNEGVDVESLKVSSRWRRRFHLIKAAGGIGNAGFGTSGFNVLGFLVGPIYYLFKGMWKKAIGLFALMMGINIAFGIVVLVLGIPPGIDRPLSIMLSLCFSITFALRANIDYYKKKILNDNSWL